MCAERTTRCLVGVCLVFLAACEVGTGRRFIVIPGPSVPSPLPTAIPFVWDTREELDIWVNNSVTRGPVPISLAGAGVDGLIRIETERGVDGWVLRGPDVNPPESAQALRIRYRWAPDPSLSPTASRTFHVRGIFDVVNPAFAPNQPGASLTLAPAADWTAADFRPALPPFEVRYVYLVQWSANPGVFEIDRIELVR